MALSLRGGFDASSLLRQSCSFTQYLEDTEGLETLAGQHREQCLKVFKGRNV